MPKNNQADLNSLKKNKTKNFFSSTRFLILGLWAIGAIFIVGGFLVGSIIYHQNPPDMYYGIVMAVGIPWLIFGCVFVILRKEIPRFGLSNITGKIVQG